MRPSLLAFSLAALAGCSGPSVLTAADLAGTTWSELCPGSDPEVSYIRLEPDGQFAWSYESPDAVAVDAGESWTVEGSTLTISWTDGFARTAYDLASGPDRLSGSSSKSCGTDAVLVRVR